MGRKLNSTGKEMREQRLTDGWGSYYTAGRMCHLLPVACLPLPLVSFMAVITERVHGQTAPPEIPVSHIKHMHTETHTNYILTFHSKQSHRQDTMQVGGGSHQEVLHLSGLLQDLVCP